MTPFLGQLQQHFEVLHDLFIDCDGKSQLVHTILELSGIAHACYGGKVDYQDSTLAPHFWVALELEQRQYLIDYSLHQWLPDEPDVPCGIFRAEDFPRVRYEGIPTPLPFLPKPVFQITQLDPRHKQILAYALLPQSKPW